MVNEEKVVLSPESAQFLLEGVRFFHQNPQTPDWNNLKRETFLFLAQRLSQLTPEEEEGLTDYLERLEQYLNQVVSQELIAPSLPPNLKELVAAFEEFQKQRDTDIKPPIEIKTPTIEDWIKNLQLQEKTQSVLEQAISAPKETLEQITPEITKAVAVNAPQLTDKEISQLSSLEKNKIIENVYNAALPEIATALVENNINLSGKQTAGLIDQLVLQTQAHIFDLSAVPPVEEPVFPALTKLLHPHETIAALFNRRERQISQALKKDPTLPYGIAPQDEAPLGEQIRSVLIVNGINKQTAPLAQSLKQEAQGLVFTVRGISSDVLYQSLRQGKIDNRPGKEISQITFLLNYQKDFEEKHPHLAKIFKRIHRNQEVLTGVKNDQVLPAPPYWLVKSTNQELDQSRRWRLLRPINTVFEKTGLAIRKKASPFRKIVRDWWQKTGLGKRSASRAQIGVKKFFENTLSQLGLFKKAALKGAAVKTGKKGLQKIFSSLATKLAGTKIGALLGSAPGAIIGLAIDIGTNFFKKGIGLFNNFLASVTGGPTEAEQKLKATLGPFSFLASPLALILIAAICVPLLLTLQNSLTTRGAFIVPSVGGGEPIPTLPSLPPNPDNGLAEKVAAILRDCGFDKDTYINIDSLFKIENCFNNSSLSAGQKQALIAAFSQSINTWKSLQCVGFVRAIEAAQGRTLPGCGESAKDWANPNCYTGQSHYQLLDHNCSQVNAGTIAVFTGGTDGHIGIITKRIESEVGGETRFRFVSAIGNPGSLEGGKITIVEYPCGSFDAFIQPK